MEDAEILPTREQKIKLIEQEPDEQIVLAFNNYDLPDVEDFHYELYHSLSSERITTFSVFDCTINSIHCRYW